MIRSKYDKSVVLEGAPPQKKKIVDQSTLFQPGGGEDYDHPIKLAPHLSTAL